MTDSKEMIKKLGLTPNKALGQNFLIDTEAISRIAALADCQGENVLEIGPGLGALTSALSEKAKNLLAVEIDRTLVGILADKLADKRSVQHLQRFSEGSACKNLRCIRRRAFYCCCKSSVLYNITYLYAAD